MFLVPGLWEARNCLQISRFLLGWGGGWVGRGGMITFFACARMVDVTPLWCWWNVHTWSMLRHTWGGMWWHVFHLNTWSMLRHTWGGVGCEEHMADATPHVGWGGVVKGKVNAALLDYLYSWLWRYWHIPHDLNVNECMTKVGHLAGNK